MIAEQTLAAIRDRTDIAALIGETVKLKRRGRSWLGLCPFHKEKSPSFSVNAERGVYYCFGCKEHGSAIDFVMKQEGRTFPEAARALAERAGIAIEETRTDAERKEAAAARRATEDLYDVNAMAATFYEHSLRGGPGTPAHPMAHHAAAEIARRGLTLDNEALTAFRVGYAPHAWDALTCYLQKHGVSPATAERAGLLVPRTTGGGYYDRFRHRLMFAVLDVAGRVVAFSGRALPGIEGEPPAKYINSPESPVYTKGEHLFGLYQARQAIRQSGEAVLVEGNFDVVSLHARRIANVVAPLGTALTEHQARLLRRFAPSVTLMFDGDDAGKKATWAARVPCRAAGLSVRGAAVPAGMDPDDMAQKQGPEAVATLLSGALPLAQRLLDVLLRDGEFEGRAVHDQAARARAALQLISEAGDDVERTVLRSYADRLAQGLRVGGLQELEAALRRPARTEQPKAATTLAQEMSLAMLGALLDFPELLDHADVQARADLMTGGAVLGVLALRGPMDTLLVRLPKDLQPFAAHRLAAPLFDSPDEALRSFRAYAKKIHAANLRRPAEAR